MPSVWSIFLMVLRTLINGVKAVFLEDKSIFKVAAFVGSLIWTVAVWVPALLVVRGVQGLFSRLRFITE